MLFQFTLLRFYFPCWYSQFSCVCERCAGETEEEAKGLRKLMFPLDAKPNSLIGAFKVLFLSMAFRQPQPLDCVFLAYQMACVTADAFTALRKAELMLQDKAVREELRKYPISSIEV